VTKPNSVTNLALITAEEATVLALGSCIPESPDGIGTHWSLQEVVYAIGIWITNQRIGHTKTMANSVLVGDIPCLWGKNIPECDIK
jgi:hypothetical protein